ncbi:MAG: DUF943 family protein [Pantoea sp. Pent]|nr:DUF943 family protein [Pantoea sp. Pent]
MSSTPPPRGVFVFSFRAFHENGPITYYFYTLGEGYQPSEKKDRICFKQMPPC